MVTKGKAITELPIDDVLEVVLQCCREKKIQNLEIDRTNYKIKGETPFSMISQRSKAKIAIKLKSLETIESVPSTTIVIYDFNDHLVEAIPDNSFILPFQKCLENKIPLKSKFELSLTVLKDSYSIKQKKSRKSRQKLFAAILISAIIIIPLASLVNPESNFSKFLNDQQSQPKTLEDKIRDVSSEDVQIRYEQTRFGKTLIVIIPPIDSIGLFSDSDWVKLANRNIGEILRTVYTDSKYIDIQLVAVAVNANFMDDDGVEEEITGYGVSLSRETASKINWKNFIYANPNNLPYNSILVPSRGDDIYLHPSFNVR